MPEWNLGECYYQLNGKFNESHTRAEFEFTKAIEFKKRKQTKKTTTVQNESADGSVENAQEGSQEPTPSEDN